MSNRPAPPDGVHSVGQAPINIDAGHEVVVWRALATYAAASRKSTQQAAQPPEKDCLRPPGAPLKEPTERSVGSAGLRADVDRSEMQEMHAAPPPSPLIARITLYEHERRLRSV